MAWKKSAPDYALPYMGKGMFVHVHSENSCYLYHRTSRRIDGRKNPLPVDRYLGIITRTEGFIPKARAVLDTTNIQVYEYGWSRTIQLIVPESWKRAAGKNWEDMLRMIIVEYSSNSYLKSEMTPALSPELTACVKTQKVSLFRRLKEEQKIANEDLEPLKEIYLLQFGKDSKVHSAIHSSQQDILNRLQIQLEVY